MLASTEEEFLAYYDTLINQQNATKVLNMLLLSIYM